MEKGKLKLFACICALLFGLVSCYLLFFVGNTDKYDSKVKAYKIYPNEGYGSDEGTYSPIYYFKVDEKEYACNSSMRSSKYPNEDKNEVYYDSENPEKCMTEYDKSSGKVGGIICLIAAIFIIYFFIIRRPKELENSQSGEIDVEKQQKIEANVEKAINTVWKIELFVKRVIIGIIILVLLFVILIESSIFKQTITAKNYIDTTATYVGFKDESNSEYDNHIYTFKDKQGNDQEIIIEVSKEESPRSEIKIKYNEKDPKQFYEEGMTFDNSGLIWYFVKLGLLLLLIILFFNKKLLNIISITSGKRHNME